MGAVKHYPEYAVNAVLAPKHYFEFIRDRDDEGARAGAFVGLISIAFFGLLNGLKSAIAVNGTVTSLEISGSKLLSVFLGNFGDGAFSIALSGILTFLMIHAVIKLLGESDWRKSFSAVAYATPVLFLTGSVIVGYQLFEIYVVGFPLLRFLGLGLALFYGVYIQSRGIEALHNLSFRKSLAVALTPAVLKITIFAALVSLNLLNLYSIGA